jgi:transcriptional regulator with XRE-family HTH domain
MTTDLARFLTMTEKADPGPVVSGLELRSLRVRAGVSQSDAASAANVSRSTWQRWERTDTGPSWDDLQRVRQVVTVLRTLARSTRKVA